MVDAFVSHSVSDGLEAVSHDAALAYDFPRMRPDIAADMARSGFAPRRIRVCIAFSVSKLKKILSFETEKKSLSERRHQL